MQNNQLTHFDEGGSHQQNPLGGIPVGNGNSVEQGETKQKDFVYSDRIPINEDVVKQFHLPNYIKNKTIADASKAIDNKFKDRHDKYAMETKNTLLDRLAQAQESIKAQQEQVSQSLQANSEQPVDMMNDDIPEGMEEYTQQPQQNQMFAGGPTFGGPASMNSYMSTNPNMASGMGSIAGGGFNPSLQQTVGKLAGGIGNTLKQTFSTPQSHDALMSDQDRAVNKSWESIKDGVAKVIPMATLFQGVEKLGKGVGQAIGGDKGGDVTQGFLDPFSNVIRQDTNFGEKLGSVADPIVAGLITSKKNNEKRVANARQYSNQLSMLHTDKDFAMGGNLKRKANGGPIGPEIDNYYNSNSPYFSLNKTTVGPTQDFTRSSFPNGMYDSNTLNFPYGKYAYTPQQTQNPNSNAWSEQYKGYSNLGKEIGVTPTQSPTMAGKALDYLDKNGGKFLKYTPVAMNAYQLSQLKKPKNAVLNRLGDKYVPQYIDEAQLQKIANESFNNTINSISQSGASQGAIRTTTLGAGLNKIKGLSDAYMTSKGLNNAQNEKAQAFDLGVNQFNAQTQHQESDNWEKNDAAYRNEKSKYLAAIGTDLGAIGKEEVNKNQIAEALGYSWDGKYMVSKTTGEKKTAQQVIDEYQKSKQPSTAINFGDPNKFAGTSISSNRYGGYLKNNKKGY